MASLEKVSVSGGNIDKIDRISQLQDELLDHILSFLDVFDAVGAGFLSKRWERLCSALPFLDIDIAKLCNQKNVSYFADLSVEIEDFISWVLTSRSAIKIIRLKIRGYCMLSQEQVFRWMCAAARRNIQELILSFVPDKAFHIPFSLVNGQSLQILELHLNGKALHLPNYPGFLQLKSLSLKNIKLIDEDLTRRFFSGCPVLKILVLGYCTFEDIEVLHISSVSIEHLIFEKANENSEGYDKIVLKISCPKLLAFKYASPMAKQYIFEDVSSLEIMHIHSWICFNDSVKPLASSIYRVLQTVHKVVDLKLGLYTIMALFILGDEFRCTLCSFHGLKSLNLWITLCDDFMRFICLFLEHCPNLEAFTLYLDTRDIDMSKMEDFSKITCMRSSVNTVRLINFKGEKDEIELARTLLECGLVLKKFVLYWSPDNLMYEVFEMIPRDEAIEMISSFPKSSGSVETVFVDPDSSISFEDWLSM